jgi:mevalonate kinase
MTSTANGKVLLFGEHAVVHGCSAIAAGIPAGARASIHSADQWHLRAPCWGVDVKQGATGRLGEALDVLADIAGGDPRRIEIASELPAGAGLGSSAAMAVAAIRALRADSGSEPFAFDELWHAAMRVERVFHGNPSGLDHAAAIRGGVFGFTRNSPLPDIAPIHIAAPLHLVIAQAEPGANTGEMVAQFTRRLADCGRAGKALLGAFSAIVDEAAEAIARGDLHQTGELMNINHGLLHGMGVSTPALDAACRIAREAGSVGAKLTGAGGGGCMIALCAGEAEQLTTRAALDSICMATWAIHLRRTP